MGLIKKRKKEIEGGIIIAVIALGIAFVGLSIAQQVSNKVVQNACDGVKRIYGRCETGSVVIDTPICCPIIAASFPVVASTVIFSIPFTNIPELSYSWFPSSNLGGTTESDLIMYAGNATKIGNTCIGCSRYTYPAVGLRTVIPGGTGWISVEANDGFQNNNFPLMPTNALLEMNINSVSNLTTNGRTFWVQALDPYIDHTDCLTQMWENITYSPMFLSNYGAFDIRGALTGAQGGSGGTAQINGTLWNDFWTGSQQANCQGDAQLRVVGALTSGHETVTYSKILIAFFYSFPFSNVYLSGTSSIGFQVNIVASPGNAVTITWKAESESG